MQGPACTCSLPSPAWLTRGQFIATDFVSPPSGLGHLVVKDPGVTLPPVHGVFFQHRLP